ncbi:MAG: SH3 domain-containing protein [Streptococcus sp.]
MSQPATTTDSDLPSQGTYVYKERTEVKNQPKVSAKAEFYVNPGDSVLYDQVVADGTNGLATNHTLVCVVSMKPVAGLVTVIVVMGLANHSDGSSTTGAGYSSDRNLLLYVTQIMKEQKQTSNLLLFSVG